MGVRRIESQYTMSDHLPQKVQTRSTRSAFAKKTIFKYQTGLILYYEQYCPNYEE